MKLSQITEKDNEIYRAMIGKKVWKKTRPNDKKEPNPFKSGLKINTVKGIIYHLQLGCLAFTFEEDDSYVACYICGAV